MYNKFSDGRLTSPQSGRFLQKRLAKGTGPGKRSCAGRREKRKLSCLVR